MTEESKPHEYRPLSDEEKLKILAEKEKLGAETIKLKAEVAKIRAEQQANLITSKILQEAQRLEVQKLDLEVIEAKAIRRARDLEMVGVEYRYAAEHAQDIFHHLYRFHQSVSVDSVRECIKVLSLWDRTEAECEMEIAFTSPGGSVIDGMELFDVISALRTRHHITTSTFGIAASMAGILLQAGDVRVMHRESWLLIHEIAFGAIGKIGEVEDTVEWAKKIEERVLNIFALRCKEAKEAGTASKALSKAQIEKNWRRKDWWIGSDEALEYGLVDLVV